MKFGVTFTLFFCLTGTIILSHCGGSSVKNPGDLSIDVATMATPKGERLKPAEDGPIRSALGQPKVDLDTFQLSISGLVDLPFSLTWEEIQNWPAVYTGKTLMYCVEGWEVWGNWRGVLVKDLLQKASLKGEAQYVSRLCWLTELVFCETP